MRRETFISAGVSHLNSSGGVDGDDAARSTNAQGRALLRLTPTATVSARVYASDAFAQLNEDPQAVGAIPATGVVEARPLSREELRRYERGTPLAQLGLDGATFLPAANDADFSRAGRFFSGALAFAQRPSAAFGYTFSYHGLVTRNSFREGPAVPGDPFGRFSGFVNTGGGLSRGIELSGEFAPSRRFDLFASYTHTNSDQRRAVVAGVLRAFAVADHQFPLVATGRIGSRVAVNFDLVASSDYLAPIFDPPTFANRAYRFDGMRKGDLTAGYTFPLSESRRLRLFGKIENVFGQDYYGNGFRTPGRQGRAGAALHF